MQTKQKKYKWIKQNKTNTHTHTYIYIKLLSPRLCLKLIMKKKMLKKFKKKI